MNKFWNDAEMLLKSFWTSHLQLMNGLNPLFLELNWYTKGNTKRCEWNPPNSCCCLVFIFDKFYFNMINIIFVHNFISASFLWNPKYVTHSWMLMNYLPLFWQDSYLEKRILPLNSIHQDTYFEFVFIIFFATILYF